MPRSLPVLCLVLLLLCSCNFVALRESGLYRAFGNADMRAQDEAVGDAQLHYWASESLLPDASNHHASRPVALLLHGFGASAIWQWHEQVGPLAETHRVVVPDLLWFGDSASTNRDYALDHQGDVMLALLDRLGVERVDLVGISYGGLVAYELASQHPERVEHLVIVDSPGRVYRRADYDALCRRFSVKHIADLLVPRNDQGVSQLMQLAYFDPPWVPEWALGQVREGLYSDHLEEKRGLLDALLRDLDQLSRRPDPSASTFLLWGRQDPVFPLSIGKRLQRHLGPNTQLAIIEDAKHAPNLEHPVLFNLHLGRFLASRDDQSAAIPVER